MTTPLIFARRTWETFENAKENAAIVKQDEQIRYSDFGIDSSFGFRISSSTTIGALVIVCNLAALTFISACSRSSFSRRLLSRNSRIWRIVLIVVRTRIVLITPTKNAASIMTSIDD